MAYKAQDFIDAIPGTGGNVSQIADRVGCIWHTVRSAIDKYATVREAYEAECQKVTDKAKSNITKAIVGGDIPTSKWYLQMKDPEFMPKERREIDQSGGVEIVVRYADDKRNDTDAS